MTKFKVFTTTWSNCSEFFSLTRYFKSVRTNPVRGLVNLSWNEHCDSIRKKANSTQVVNSLKSISTLDPSINDLTRFEYYCFKIKDLIN